jgi:hypothetical protein
MPPHEHSLKSVTFATHAHREASDDIARDLERSLGHDGESPFVARNESALEELTFRPSRHPEPDSCARRHGHRLLGGSGLVLGGSLPGVLLVGECQAGRDAHQDWNQNRDQSSSHRALQRSGNTTEAGEPAIAADPFVCGW